MCLSVRPRHLDDDCGWKKTNRETLTCEMRNPKALAKGWGTANEICVVCVVFFCSKVLIYLYCFVYTILLPSCNEGSLHHRNQNCEIHIWRKTVRSINMKRDKTDSKLLWERLVKSLIAMQMLLKRKKNPQTTSANQSSGVFWTHLCILHVYSVLLDLNGHCGVRFPVSN